MSDKALYYYPDQTVEEPDPCRYEQVHPQPDLGSPDWGGNDPAHGRLWTTECPDAFLLGVFNPGGTAPIVYRATGTYYVPDGLPPGSSGPDPQAVLDRAVGKLEIPTPEPELGPDLSKVAVKVPVWLWIANADPITVSSTAGPITATVTARLTSTTWQMGEPIDPAHPGTAPAPVTCQGAGSPYTAGTDPKKPPCGYTYIWQSLPERTGGSGTWTITVTATWTVSWALTTGETGAQDVTTQATIPVHVGEWHVVLVEGGH